MPYTPGILIGQITKTSGFEGTVIVRLEKRFIEDIPEPESVFLEIDGRPVPFFIDSLEYSGGDILKLSFTGYDSPDKVSEFRGCNVFLTAGSPEKEAADPGLLFLKGYTVADADKNTVGIVKEVISNPGQFLLDIETAGGEQVLVPLHEDLIVSIDKKGKKIIMDLPEGLREINM
jgi:16S rRNA processing protein RimM